MHLIHKLRRSISHRPRHLLDLPDEILCLILEYCCQDLDFLLWSCPLVTLEDQFCHDCYHCTLCHGPAIRLQDSYPGWNSHRRRAATMYDPRTALHHRSSTTIPNSSKTSWMNNRSNHTRKSVDTDHGSSSRGHIALRKRRKRLSDLGFGEVEDDGGIRSTSNTGFSRSTAPRQHHTTGSSSSTSPPTNSTGTRPCPRNGNRLWCQHLQQQQRYRSQDGSIKQPFLWRLLAPISDRLQRRPYHQYIHERPTSIRSFLPTVQLIHITAMSSSLMKLLQYPGRSALDWFIQPLDDDEPETTHASVDSAQSTGSRPPQQDGLHRRRAMSMITRPFMTSSNTPEVPMGRAWSSTGSTVPLGFYSGDNDLEALASDCEEEGEDLEEYRDDFDDSIHLAAPFQLLLVSRQFADAAAQSLWRNLVFHGHDAFQMQSLLTTLYKDDGLSDNNLAAASGKNRPRQPSIFGPNSLQELMEEEDKESESWSAASHSPKTGTRTETMVVDVLDSSRSHSGAGTAAAVDSIYSSGSAPPFTIQRNNLSDDNSTQASFLPEEQGLMSSINSSVNNINSNNNKRSWIDSLNGSLKRFSRFQGGLDPNTEGSSSSSYCDNSPSRPSSTSGILGGTSSPKMATRSSGRSQLQALPPWPRPHQAKWPYRRHVRRVVLNFAHPQASPQSLVKVLECLHTRCPDQIQALDLHANEKMQEAGLENPEELNRLFGTGFSKLRYLRLQGGFVDNQLLCALINGLRGTLKTKDPKSIAASTYPLPGLSSELKTSPLDQIPTCRLSQVFLGPGSVTNSAIEKLIAATGHSLEVFTVTSCVDVGGSALASLLTKCPRLRVLAVHRSLAQDRELLEGLGIELEEVTLGSSIVSQSNNTNTSSSVHTPPSNTQVHGSAHDTASSKEKVERKTIVAPLERLEFGTVKLTKVGVSEILKGTCKTLRFLVLETQHFSEDFLTEVVTPFCTQLEGLYFDDPEQLQRQQQQLQGLGFSAGRRRRRFQGEGSVSGRNFAPLAPDWSFQFGRSGRTFYSDPTRPTLPPRPPQPSPQQQQQSSPPFFVRSTESAERSSVKFNGNSLNVSAWLGETTTEEWIQYGDCALWTCAAGPGVSFENGGPFSSSSSSSASANGNPPGGFRTATSQQRRSQQPLPLHHVYHNPGVIMSSGRYSHLSANGGRGGAMAAGGGGGTVADLGLTAQMYQNPYHSLSFIGEYDEILARFRVSRVAIDNVLEGLARIRAFTVMQMDFILESQGLSEWKTLIRQEEAWVQSMGFKALQLFYLCLFLSTIYFGTLHG